MVRFEDPPTPAALFEEERPQLRAVAFRILGSDADVDDVLQEAWIRFDRTDTTGVRNVAAWLTTVVVRLCVDFLRRRHDVLQDPAEALDHQGPGPEEVALLADELTAAFTVVLDELTPGQRVALTLHDVFGVPFEEVAHTLDTSVDAAKKLASRARRRLREQADPAPGGTATARTLVPAFLAAARTGDTDALLRLLAPDVVRTADPQALPAGAPQRLHGADAVVAETRALRANAQHAHLALVDDRPGIVVDAGLHRRLVLVFHLRDGRIAAYDVIADPRRLARLQIS
jgi:RNA polymerase sigma factor (sigma-70 family)